MFRSLVDSAFQFIYACNCQTSVWANCSMVIAATHTCGLSRRDNVPRLCTDKSQCFQTTAILMRRCPILLAPCMRSRGDCSFSCCATVIRPRIFRRWSRLGRRHLAPFSFCILITLASPAPLGYHSRLASYQHGLASVLGGTRGAKGGG